MITRLIFCVLTACLVGGAFAEEVKVKKSDLAFPIPAPLVAELASVQLKLFPRHNDDIKRFGKPDYQRAFVASIIGKGEKKFIFVGFPVNGNEKSTYEVVMQYCDKAPSYEIERAGLTTGNPDELYQEFISANGMDLIQLDDICGQLYKLGE